MTAKRSNNEPEVETANDGDEESISDGPQSSSSSSSSSDESSSDDSSTESPPTEDINGDQIRKNARELLHASPDKVAGIDVSKKTMNNTITSSSYQSYQDAPTVRMSSVSSSQYNNNNSNMMSSNPPWNGSSGSSTDEGLSVTDVATMAFSCVVHCVTESYRAASNYYSGDYPSVSDSNNNSQNYQQVAGSYHQSTQSSSIGYNNGYSDGGYQTKFSEQPSQEGEVMDRGDSKMQSNNTYEQQASQTSGEQTVQKEEWSTVHVPSTYQGGRL